MADFEWTAEREKAAQLLSEGRLTDQEIADECGVCRATLYNWRKLEPFAARVAEHLAVFRDEVHRRGIACRDRRVKRQNDHWNRLQRIIEARADLYARLATEDPPEGRKKPDIHPGALTGLMVFTDDGWEVDTDTLKELRALEQHAAKELGQWTDKHTLDLSNLSDEEVLARATGIAGRGGAPGPGAA